MEKKFDPTKPVQTRDGRKARIICTDRDFTGYSIVALIKTESEEERIEAYRSDGSRKFYRDDLDLINVPEKVTMYVNVYRDADHKIGCGYAYTTEEHARKNAVGACVADIAVPITIEI